MSGIPTPIYFVNRVSGAHLAAIDEGDGDVHKLPGQMVDTRDSWITQTYLELKKLGLEVALSDQMVPDHICVAHYDDVLLGDRDQQRSFLIAIRPDRPPIPLAELRVVQNKSCIYSDRDFFIHHWPQPGLIPRDPARGNKVERLAYVGRAYNLRPELQTEEFRARLAEIDVELDVLDNRDEDTTLHDYERWSDYSQTDLVFAVRPDDKGYWNYTKPASKLVNAWLAGCPSLLGKEPGFQQVRESDLDYIEVETPEDVVQGVLALKNDPRLYQDMIEHGFERAKEFSREHLAHRWFDFLTSERVRSAYQEWRRARNKAWLLLPQAGYAFRSALHLIARKRPEWSIVVR